MAVIKIVPMPGAVGDKGDEGAVGPRGLQGEQGLQGAPGADALWNYNGEYNPGAGYAVGDVVTYNGQTWYRKNSNGGNVGDTPSQGIFWDLVAAKGADSIAPTSGTWDTKFAFHSGIELSEANQDIYNTHKMGSYYCVGDLVHFDFRMLLSNPTSWGSNSLFAFELPFPPYSDLPNPVPGVTGLYNHLNRIVVSGWYRVVADVDPQQTLPPTNEGGWLTANESHFIFANAILRSYPLNTETGRPITNGRPMGSTVEDPFVPYPENTQLIGMAHLFANDLDPDTVYPNSENTATIGYRSISSTWPANLVQALADQNDGIPGTGTIDANQNGIQFNFSGVYRKA